jgi:hypothetical protein
MDEKKLAGIIKRLSSALYLIAKHQGPPPIDDPHWRGLALETLLRAGFCACGCLEFETGGSGRCVRCGLTSQAACGLL